MSGVLLAAALFLVTGCYRSYGRHVSFPPLPPPDAPAPVRESAYLVLHSTSVRDDEHFTLSGGPDWYPLYLELGNGTHVRELGDLVPLVGEDTPFAESVRRNEHARRKKALGKGLVYGGIFVGVQMLALGIVTAARARDRDKVGGMPGAVSLIVLGGATLGGVAGYGLYTNIHYSGVEQQSQADATKTWNAALASRLRLCVAGLRVEPCP